MAKYFETFVNGEAQYIVLCKTHGCSWTHYELLTPESACFYDEAHAQWHKDGSEAERERVKRRDEIR